MGKTIAPKGEDPDPKELKERAIRGQFDPDGKKKLLNKLRSGGQIGKVPEIPKDWK
jgi:hypothetical protein